ncbi:MAG TPA: hypothetical protein VFR50_14170 [Casimicrobiaceae bacterium]|nr:hypothetical protein [Casimicrobiaceae bacterium]
MNKLLAVLAAGFLAATSAQLFAAETNKDAAPAATAPTKLEKPAGISQEAWNKMSDAEKKKAVEAAAKGDKTATKKEKKGGC